MELNNIITLTGWAIENYWYDPEDNRYTNIVSPLFLKFDEAKQWLLHHVPTDKYDYRMKKLPVVKTISVNSIKDLIPFKTTDLLGEDHHYVAVYIEDKRALSLIGQTEENLYNGLPILEDNDDYGPSGIDYKIVRHSIQISNQFFNTQQSQENYELISYELEDMNQYQEELNEYWEHTNVEPGDEEMADELEPKRETTTAYLNTFFNTKEEGDQYLRSLATQTMTWEQYCQHWEDVNITSKPLLIYIDNIGSWDPWNQGQLFKIMPNEPWSEASWYTIQKNY